jgi:hypothetical protein
MNGIKVDASSEAPAWYPDTIPNHDVITGMIALQATQGATRIEGRVSSTPNTSLHQGATSKNTAPTSESPAPYAGALKVSSLMDSVRRGDIVSLSHGHLRWLQIDPIIDQRVADEPGIRPKCRLPFRGICH